MKTTAILVDELGDAVRKFVRVMLEQRGRKIWPSLAACRFWVVVACGPVTRARLRLQTPGGHTAMIPMP